MTAPAPTTAAKAALAVDRVQLTPAGFAPDTTNPKDLLGAKKPQTWLVPGVLLIEAARAFEDGARKYGPYNWREKKVRATVYASAIQRHLGAWLDGERLSKDAAVHHLGHVAACVAILLDAESTGNLIDDRPTPGAFGALIETYTKKDA